MRFISIQRGVFRPSLLLGAAVLSSVACNTKDVLGVFDPAVATPGSLTTAAAVPVVYAGAIGDFAETYLVGTFEEAVLLAYQKSRSGDIILLSPGCSSFDMFRNYEERGDYFKKLVNQGMIQGSSRFVYRVDFVGEIKVESEKLKVNLFVSYAIADKFMKKEINTGASVNTRIASTASINVLV